MDNIPIRQSKRIRAMSYYIAIFQLLEPNAIFEYCHEDFQQFLLALYRNNVVAEKRNELPER